MGLHYEVMYSEIQTKFWGGLLTIYYQGFVWENWVTTQHSCHCDTVSCAAQTIGESGNQKYVPLSVCLVGRC